MWLATVARQTGCGLKRRGFAPLAASTTLTQQPLIQKRHYFFNNSLSPESEDFPVFGRLHKIMHPIKSIKFKMSRIDDARNSYELCSLEFEKDAAFFRQRLNIPDNFQSWFSLTVLHIWMYNTRLKQEGDAGKEMRQELFNHLWLDVEVQLAKAGVKFNFGGIIKDLLASYYGSTLGYDEGLAKGDMYLSSALHRNITGEYDLDQLVALTEYVRMQLHYLESKDRADVLTGRINWQLLTEKHPKTI